MNSIRRFWVLVLLIIFFVIFLFFSFNFFGFFVQSKLFFKTFTDRSFSFKELKRLQSENDILRGELERVRKNRNAIVFDGNDNVKVAVYSNYPFNDKSFLVINYGKNKTNN